MTHERSLMTAFQMIVRPAASVIERLGDLVTYDDVPLATEQRADSCPYLGHIPYFAPKLGEDESE